jgi:hypothetical protein
MSLAKELVASGLHFTQAQAINGSVATGLVATGSTQATALPLTSQMNVLATTAASTGVILPVLERGDSVFIRNGGANSLSIYPPVGGVINALSANAAFALAAGSSVTLNYVSTVNAVS